MSREEWALAMRVLVIGESALGTSIRRSLDAAGIDTELAADAAAADGEMRERHYDGLVLDVPSAGAGGEPLLRSLRARGTSTAVMLLLAPCPVTERVRLLDLGADDYLARPFDPVELVAKLRALLRRSVHAGDTLACGALHLLRHERVATLHGRRIDLTNREFCILDVLMRNPARSLSRRQLEESLYGWGDEVESNAIEVHIHHLRRKLGASLIQTVRGVGYQLVPDGDGTANGGLRGN